MTRELQLALDQFRAIEKAARFLDNDKLAEEARHASLLCEMHARFRDLYASFLKG